MKVTNNTVWRTDHLKAILQRAAEQEFDDGARRRRLRVTVDYTRGGDSSGCAWIGSNTCVVRIENPKGRHRVYREGAWVQRHKVPMSDTELRELRLRFASVAVHEFAHCRGMDHHQMPGYYKWSGNWRPYVEWAADLPLAVKPQPVKARPSVDDKLTRARAGLKLAETRLKRATTLHRKWRLKVRYYERKAVAGLQAAAQESQ